MDEWCKLMSKIYSLIGVLGGTFDPVHNGHLAIADALIHALPLQEIQFIPCQHPPHRAPPTANALHRLAMLQLALQDYSKFKINEVELSRSGPSYMVDTLKQLKEMYPDNALGLIIGLDVLWNLNTWHRWTYILERAHLIVVNRPGYDLPFAPWLQSLISLHQFTEKDQLLSQPCGGIFFQHVPPQSSSASAIRQLLKEGREITGEVPPRVAAYITQHHLYT